MRDVIQVQFKRTLSKEEKRLVCQAIKFAKTCIEFGRAEQGSEALRGAIMVMMEHVLDDGVSEMNKIINH